MDYYHKIKEFYSNFDFELNNKKTITFIMNKSKTNWWIYTLKFSKNNDECYSLFLENNNSIIKKTNSFLILKIMGNNYFLKEVNLKKYDNYKWNNNEHPIVFNHPHYIEKVLK